MRPDEQRRTPRAAARANQSKDEKEKVLGWAPPKGSNLVRVRRQKAELKDEVVKLEALLSKVRLEIKRCQI
jgi:hypothetical protein